MDSSGAVACVAASDFSAVSAPYEAVGASSNTLEPLERVYDGCLGGFLADKSRFHLRIAADGTLRGEVRRKLQQQKEGGVNSRNKRKRRVIADHPDGIVVAHLVGNAQTVPKDEAIVSTVEGDGTAAEYCCWFEVTKRLNHVDRNTLTCHLHVPMAPDVSAMGTWKFYDMRLRDRHLVDESSSASTASTSDASPVLDEVSETPEQKVFQLEPVQWHQRQQEAEAAEKEAAAMQSRPPSLLYPLRPGKYEFRGFTTYDVPAVAAQGRRRARAQSTVKDECLVTLRLLPDGTLRGTSREVVQPQVCPLRGRWQANRVAYVLEYRVREAVGHFRYSGAVVIEEGVDSGKSKAKKSKAARKTTTQSTAGRREALSGKWHNVDEGHAEGYQGGRGQFELELVRVDFSSVSIKTERLEQEEMVRASATNGETAGSSQPSPPDSGGSADNAIVLDDDDDADVIRKFTTGEYELAGRATDTDGYEYAFDVKLQLRAGGKLFGESTEHVFQQKGPIFGIWRPSGFVYQQQYVVKHEVGVYTYAGDITRDGAVVNGTWANAEKESATANSEHGTFALLLVNATRVWSPSSHVDYPASFRRGVLTTLMASARTHALPVALWTHLFTFCHEKWFTPTTS